jgi:hypothetical protein
MQQHKKTGNKIKGAANKTPQKAFHNPFFFVFSIASVPAIASIEPPFSSTLNLDFNLNSVKSPYSLLAVLLLLFILLLFLHPNFRLLTKSK